MPCGGPWRVFRGPAGIKTAGTAQWASCSLQGPARKTPGSPLGGTEGLRVFERLHPCPVAGGQAAPSHALALVPQAGPLGEQFLALSEDQHERRNELEPGLSVLASPTRRASGAGETIINVDVQAQASIEALAEVKAQHAEAAGLAERALAHWEQAGAQALARPAYKEAIASL